MKASFSKPVRVIASIAVMFLKTKTGLDCALRNRETMREYQIVDNQKERDPKQERDCLAKSIDKLRINPQCFIFKLEARLDCCSCDPKSNRYFTERNITLASDDLCKDCKELQEAITYLRNRNSTHPLCLLENLSKAAESHATDLASGGAQGHVSSSGSPMHERLSAHGDWTTCVGENIFLPTNNAGEKVANLHEAMDDLVLEMLISNGWRDRRNLLSERFHFIGIGQSSNGQEESIWVINFAGDFAPPVKKVGKSRFTRYQEAQGEITEDMEKLLNTVPFKDLREKVRQTCLQPDVVVVLEVSPGQVNVNFIDHGVTKVLSGSWEIVCEEHRTFYRKTAEWGTLQEDCTPDSFWTVSDTDQEGDVHSCSSAEESDISDINFEVANGTGHGGKWTTPPRRLILQKEPKILDLMNRGSEGSSTSGFLSVGSSQYATARPEPAMNRDSEASSTSGFLSVEPPCEIKARLSPKTLELELRSSEGSWASGFGAVDKRLEAVKCRLDSSSDSSFLHSPVIRGARKMYSHFGVDNMDSPSGNSIEGFFSGVDSPHLFKQTGRKWTFLNQRRHRHHTSVDMTSPNNRNFMRYSYGSDSDAEAAPALFGQSPLKRRLKTYRIRGTEMASPNNRDIKHICYSSDSDDESNYPLFESLFNVPRWPQSTLPPVVEPDGTAGKTPPILQNINFWPDAKDPIQVANEGRNSTKSSSLVQKTRIGVDPSPSYRSIGMKSPTSGQFWPGTKGHLETTTKPEKTENVTDCDLNGLKISQPETPQKAILDESGIISANFYEANTPKTKIPRPGSKYAGK